MNYNQVVIKRARRRFGRQCLFEDRNELMVSVHPSSRIRQKYIMYHHQDKALQLSTQMAFSEVETENVTYEERGMCHIEGGWPNDVNLNDEEATERHRKKVERADSWGPEVKALIKATMATATQNNAINIYYHYFDDLPTDLGRTICMPFKSRTINILRDVWNPQREVGHIDWMPNNKKLIMIQYTNNRKDLKLQTDDATVESYNSFFTWEMKDPSKPQYYYDSAELMSQAKICPKDDTYMAGGTLDGKVCLWNTFEGGMPTDICELESAHREATTAIAWVHSNLNTEFYTGSLDGSVKFWDSRDLKMHTFELLLETNPQMEQNRQLAHGCTVLEFEYTIPVRFIAGSDLGHIFVCNRKANNPVDMIIANYKLFAGPIRTIHRNPFFVKNFLIVGDWRARIWCEEMKDRPSTFYVKKSSEMMCGAWSTARASLFATGDIDGVVDFWDLLLDHREPIYSIDFHSTVTALTFQPDGEHLAISLDSGETHIMNLDEAMKTTTKKEKAQLAAMFEHEIKRSKMMEARVEDVKLQRRLKKEAEEERLAKAEEDAKLEPDVALDPDDPDQFIKMIEADEEFRVALAEFREHMRAVDRKRAAERQPFERTIFEEIYEKNLEEEMKKRAAEQRPPKKKPPPAKGKK